ncbi:MAG: PAS domain S-box protein [Candidatus Zhuqueibacterota bacterium]
MDTAPCIELQNVLNYLKNELERTLNFNLAVLAVNRPNSLDLNVAITVASGQGGWLPEKHFPDALCAGFRIINEEVFILIRRQSNTDVQFIESILDNQEETQIRTSLIARFDHALLGNGYLLIGSAGRDLVFQKQQFEKIDFNALIDAACEQVQHVRLNSGHAESNIIFKDIFEHSLTPTALIKTDGRIVQANKAFEKLYGRSRSAFITTASFEDLFVSNQRKAVVTRYRNYKSFDSSPLIASFRRSNEEERVVEVQFQPMHDNGSLCVNLHDVTDYRTAHGQVQESGEQLELMSEIVAAINSKLNTDQAIQVLFNKMSQVFGYDFACVVLCDEEENKLDIRVSVDLPEIIQTKANGPVFQSYAELLKTLDPISQDREAITNLSKALGLSFEKKVKSQIFMKLTADQQLVGTILLFSEAENAVTSYHMNLFSGIVDDIAVGLLKTRMLQKSQHSLTNMSLLAQVNESISSSLDLDVVLKQVVESAQHMMNAKICTIRFLAGERADCTNARVFLDQFSPQIQRMILNQKPLVIDNIDYNNITFFKSKNDIEQLGLRSLILLPIVNDNRTIAILSVFLDRIHFFSDHELELLAMLAQQAAIAIKNASLYATMNCTKNKLESIVRSSADAIVTTDENGHITFFSDSATRLTHYSSDEVMHRPFFDHFVKNGRTLFAGLKQDLMSSQSVHNFECDVLTKEERIIPIAWSFSSLVNEKNQIIGTLGIGKDISQPKKIEAEMRKKSDELENLIYLISHNLKTPLVSLMGFVSLLLSDYRDKFDGDGKHFLDRIQKNIEYMEDMIQDLLDYSRVDRGETNFEQVDLSAVINFVLEKLAFGIQQKNIRLDIPSQWPKIFAEEQGVKNIFLNLVDNAIKYMGQNPEPTIALGYKDYDDCLVFQVRDNGMGIEKKYHDKVFQLFQRLQGIKDIEGTGIGLALVKRIVEKHYGEVWIDSELGRGTTINFKLHKEPYLRQLIEQEAQNKAQSRG